MTAAVEVRPFTESDRHALRALFGRAGEGAPPATLWGHEESEADIYLTPYMDLEPESLFVAVVDGRPAGYLAGCVDDGAFPTEGERIDRAIREHRLLLRPGAVRFFARAALDTARAALRRQPGAGELQDPRWPSHLHINLVREARGAGAGAALMTAWFDRLRDAGSPGCYLQTLVENTRAVGFFEHMGFERHGSTPVVAGIRDNGRRLHQQTMVRSVDRAV
jgi:ribosomal protein S18 acetylase RimI-like enzyme